MTNFMLGGRPMNRVNNVNATKRWEQKRGPFRFVLDSYRDEWCAFVDLESPIRPGRYADIYNLPSAASALSWLESCLRKLREALGVVEKQPQQKPIVIKDDTYISANESSVCLTRLTSPYKSQNNKSRQQIKT